MHHKAHGERTIEKISHALDLIECVIEYIKDLNFRLVGSSIKDVITFSDIFTTAVDNALPYGQSKNISFW
jgi:hypothetical protein